MPKAITLPEPSAAAKAHSEQVKQYLQAYIQHRGAIPFSDYMNQALYAPGLGFYASGNHKFGAGGDFVTAPELGALFARTLANVVADVLGNIKNASILEFGAGSGKLAGDLLLALQEKNCLPLRYVIVEISPELCERQRVWLQKHLPDSIFARIEWLSALPQQFSGVVLANEVLDALPVDVFRQTDHGLQQLFVDVVDGALAWLEKPLVPDDPILARIGNSLQPPYQFEFNRYLAPWLQHLSDRVDQAVVLLIDYGYPESSYYHPDRYMGTLSCYFQQHMHSDPLILPGIQDITAHVNFTHVAESALSAGFQLLGYTTQAHFLLDAGLLAQLPDVADQAAYYPATEELNRLTSPNEMGEAFKVMALGKNSDVLVPGFQFDQCHRL